MNTRKKVFGEIVSMQIANVNLVFKVFQDFFAFCGTFWPFLCVFSNFVTLL